MKSAYKVLALAVCLSAASCARMDSRTPNLVQTATQTPPVKKSDLHGVWEVVSCSAISRPPGGAKSTTNFKYCFNNDTAYPRLSPDAANDGADGGGEYHIVGGDILVIRTGVPGGIEAYSVALSDDRLILFDSHYRMTLRRISKSWDGRAPVIKAKDIPITS